jgi:hypothetical protein
MLCRATTRRGAIAKNVSSAEDEIVEDSVGDRRAGGCAASREKRITCVAFGIRNHPRERIAERHGAYRPALPAFGAVEQPEIYRTATVTVYRGRETPRRLAR